MIPISLIVSLELVKVIQSYFMNKDDEIKKNNYNLRINTCSINEELGMVEYLFCDKTGTLTCNKMELKYFVIGDNTFGDDH